MKLLRVLITSSIFTLCLITTVFSQSKTVDSILKKVDRFLEEDKKEEALKIAIAQLESVTKNNTIPLQIKWNSKIGHIFRKNNNYPVALTYYTTAKKTLNSNKRLVSTC